MDKITAHCPDCGSEQVRECNTAYAELEVTEWGWDDKENELTPVFYDMDVDVDWETIDGPAYRCLVCGWKGDGHELTVKGRPALPTRRAPDQEANRG